MAVQDGFEARDLIDGSALVPGVNRAFLRLRVALPIAIDGDRLVVAMQMPEDEATIAALRFAAAGPIAPRPASATAILRALDGEAGTRAG